MADGLSRILPAVRPAPWLKIAPPMTRYAFYGGAPARLAMAAAWGVAFAEEACRARTRGTRATLWLGPDEYLLLDAAPAADSEFLSRLEGARSADASGTDPAGDAAPVSGALVEISHRQFALEVHGPHAEHILCGACPLDLELGEFPVGMCTRTVLAKADIVLWRTREDTFHLEVGRSFAGYVGALLRAIASEFYPDT